MISSDEKKPKSALKKKTPTANREYAAQKRRNKSSVSFGNVDVFYFDRAQGFSTVPSTGGYALGMKKKHFRKNSYTLDQFVNEKKKNNRLCILGNPHKENKLESYTDITDIGQNEIILIEENERIQMLLRAGVKLDHNEKIECQIILESRLKNGCDCEDACNKSTCFCWKSGINCQVDRNRHPCGCTEIGCGNPYGRSVFNFQDVKSHFFEIMAKLRADKSASSMSYSNPMKAKKRDCKKKVNSSRPQSTKQKLFYADADNKINIK
ncbi:cysteine/serine-rich nuclear protein 3-like [Rhodnius prolixus]|uniref:Cysteine/serine-rich nuclear protein N-terminal domain-containing protein n=1 Tax=Rhodnius prolixus TaxID=13249 RepID=T1IG78_RHOPR